MIAAVLLLMVVGVWILTGMASYEGINSNVDSGYLVALQSVDCLWAAWNLEFSALWGLWNDVSIASDN